MARERVLNKALTVAVDKGAGAESTSYNVIRFCGAINFEVHGSFEQQRASFMWTVGRILADGSFEPMPVGGMCGNKTYDNSAPAYAFATLISKSPTLAAIQDQVFKDLEAAGEIPPGTERDYALYPPGYQP